MVDLAIGNHEARVNITYDGECGDLPDPVSFDATDGDIKQWAAEAVRAGSVPGIPAAANPDFAHFAVERFPAKEGRTHNVLMLRPKTPFG